MKQNPNAKKGFTLIELLVAMVILGILVAAGVPGMQTLLANMAVRSTSDKLVNSLAYARGEAVSRVENVSVCSSNNGVSCGATWADGWIVTSADGTVLRVVDNSAANTAIAPSGPATIAFDAQGENTQAASAFTVSSSSGTQTRQISVSVTGYTSIN